MYFSSGRPLEVKFLNCLNFRVLGAPRYIDMRMQDVNTSGCLGSSNEEGRSEVRYALRLADFREPTGLSTYSGEGFHVNSECVYVCVLRNVQLEVSET